MARITKKDLKIIKRLFLISFIIVASILLIVYYFSGLKKFSGNIEVTDKKISIQADFLNTIMDEEIELNAGDVLNIEIFKSDGELALSIISEDGDKELYSGKNLISSNFSVTALEQGKYKVKIKGKRMVGKILIEKGKTEEEMQDEARRNKLNSNK